ncbi:MAG: MarR family winged helix-turn-helix transcriptional regulator [Pseudonocardia sp.]
MLPDELARDAGFLLARAGGRAIRDLNRALAPLELRSRHYTVLLAAAGAGRSQRELGELLAIDPSAVVAIVDDLERGGLVRREPDPTDRRTRRVVATEAGRVRMREARAGARSVEEALLAELDDAERATLLALLTRIAGV